MKQMRWSFNLTLILCFSLLSLLTFAATINVPADQPTIQSGIDAAQNADTVLVDDGIYRGEGNVNIDFKGKRITLKSKNGADKTIIDCEVNFDTRGFIFQNNETANSVLDGFTVINGLHEGGSGIHLNAVSPTIKNCVIDGIGVNWGGTGISCFQSNPIITDCTITRNTWGISVTGSAPIITDCVITRNSRGISVAGDVIKKGNFFIDIPSRPTINNCIITENTGVGIGCIHLAAYATIKNCTISQNGGRGIFCNSFSGADIANCHITQNADGGLKCYEYSRIRIKNSVIDWNTAVDGAGIFCSATSSLYVSDCVIANNTATNNGGGVWDLTRFGDAVIKYSTITQNSAGNRGGGVYVSDRGRLDLTNSIVWDNTSDGTHAEVFAWGIVTIKSCNIKDGLDGIEREPDGGLFSYEDNIDEDPLFVNAKAGDFTLQANSPAAGMGIRDPEDQEPIEQEENIREENKDEEPRQDQIHEEEPRSVSQHGKLIVLWADLKHK